MGSPWRQGRQIITPLNKNEIEVECGWNCVYNSQTSSMNHHLGTVHKEYEKEKTVRIYIF